MATNKIADDKALVTFQVTKEDKEVLQQSAAESNITMGELLRTIIAEYLRDGRPLVKKELYLAQRGSVDLKKSHPPPPPKERKEKA